MTHSVINDIRYSIFAREDYLTYDEGNNNIILSAPHGGGMKPFFIPNRQYGNKGRDSYTRRLIEKIIELSRDKPFYVYSDIHRSKVDLNRDIIEGAQGNIEMQGVWHQWNDILDIYLNRVRQSYGRGLYIDLHSHNKSNKFQIGYGMSVSDYLDGLDGKSTVSTSTLSPLFLTESDPYEISFGKYSFVSLLEYLGCEVLVPRSDEEYLSGGRNIRVFNGKGIGSLQIECPVSALKKDIDWVADVLLSAIKIFDERFITA